MDFLNFLWDVKQDQDIRKAKGIGLDVSQKVNHAAVDFNFLKDTVERLAITNAALLEILQTRAGLEPNELLDKITEIDLRDGVKDGKMTPVVRVCKQCHRNANARRSKCLYCGHDIT